MDIEIGDLSDGNEWRLFSSTFGFGHELNSVDYNKICSLSEQILKNLFNIDFIISDNLSLVDIDSGEDLWSGHFRHDLYNVNVRIQHDLFSIKLSFCFNELYDDIHEGLYFLSHCKFRIADKYLLSLLPMGGSAANEVDCSTSFDVNQQYLMTDLVYQHRIYYYSFNVRKSIIGEVPSFTYKYRIKKNEINFTILYYYDQEYSSNISKKPDEYFINTEKNITPTIIEKIKIFYLLVDFYYSKFDISGQFPELTRKNLGSAIHAKKVLHDFLMSDIDVTDNILVLKMAVI